MIAPYQFWLAALALLASIIMGLVSGGAPLWAYPLGVVLAVVQAVFCVALSGVRIKR